MNICVCVNQQVTRRQISEIAGGQNITILNLYNIIYNNRSLYTYKLMYNITHCPKSVQTTHARVNIFNITILHR